MTIFRLNFLLKVGQMKVCQNPSFISTPHYYSKRVGEVSPVVWSTSILRLLSSHLSHIHSKLTNGPIAAASGALYADVRAYCSHIKNVKRTCSCCPLFRD